MLKWTSNLPTEPGWYWIMSYNKKPSMVEVRVIDGRLMLTSGVINVTLNIFEGCLWAGPIPEPEEPDGIHL